MPGESARYAQMLEIFSGTFLDLINLFMCRVRIHFFFLLNKCCNSQRQHTGQTRLFFILYDIIFNILYFGILAGLRAPELDDIDQYYV